MHILLISALPEVHGFFGLRHHYPVGGILPIAGTLAEVDVTSATTTVAGGDVVVSFTEVDPEQSGAFTSRTPPTPDGGPIIAHLSGTSISLLRVSDELRAAGIPFVYSPMIPSHPSGVARFAGWLSGHRSRAVRDFGIASEIAASAVKVVADSGFEEMALRRIAGIPANKMLIVPGTVSTDTTVQGSRSSSDEKSFGNLAVAFCDEVAPEWNVLRFLFAMEKINADAVVVAVGSDTPYARECAKRAALNERVTFLWWERGNARRIAGEVSEAIGRASIVVDPSPGGLSGVIAREFAGSGIPSVVSRLSVTRTSPADGLFPFEPSSWELLNHAITCAFNVAAVGRPKRRATDDLADRNTETARMLRRLYQQAAGA